MCCLNFVVANNKIINNCDGGVNGGGVDRQEFFFLISLLIYAHIQRPILSICLATYSIWIHAQGVLHMRIADIEREMVSWAGVNIKSKQTLYVHLLIDTHKTKYIYQLLSPHFYPSIRFLLTYQVKYTYNTVYIKFWHFYGFLIDIIALATIPLL